MRLPWPLPALLAWGLCWALFALLQPRWGLGPALLAAGLLGTLASLAGARWWRRIFIAAGFPLALLLSGAVALPAWAWLLALLLLLAVYPLNAWRDAPLFPTPEGALQGLAAAAPLAAGVRVLDAGCGLGHGLRALRAAYPQAQIEGLEWSWPLAGLCALRCPWARVRRGDIWAADWSAYQLVYVFQRPESMSRVRLQCATMAPGSYVVSLEFALPDTPASAHTVGRDGRPLWIYRLPLAD
ncbi:MAG: class I SAM-dependent methyltransferase [Comamonadaceae bacterium]|nr:class I SAM-dependent methyltransferase [Comamonadaceae bacterium]